MTSRLELTARRQALKTINAVPFLRRRLLASCDYSVLHSLNEFDAEQWSGWSSESTAAKQHRIWRNLIDSAVNGRPRKDIRLVVDALAEHTFSGAKVIEIGCGTGYFSEVLARFCPGVIYMGLDYSAEMIELARASYPEIEFIKASASDTHLPERKFDVVLDGAALIHIPDWPSAVREYFRITKETVLLSSLTLHEGSDTVLMKKLAYGTPVFEQVFSRDTLTSCIETAGGRVVETHPALHYDLAHEIGVTTTSETWVCALS